MNRILLFALITSATVAGTISARLGQADPPVNLQAATPGVQQVGNANVSGKVLAGSLSASNASPTAQVIVGNATAATGANYAGLFRTDSSAGTGIRGVASATTGNANGGTFQTGSPNGGGVRGYATSPTGTNYGVYGKAVSPNGFGVFSEGRMSATGIISGNGSGLTSVNAALLGGLPPASFLQAIPNPLALTGTSSNPIIRAENNSGATGASGVFGISTATSGQTYGVQGVSASTTGFGVTGIATSTTGINYGGYFRSASPGGFGVYSEGHMHVGGNLSIGAPSTGDPLSVSTNTLVAIRAATTGALGNAIAGHFSNASSGGAALYGASTSATGSAIGVRGFSQNGIGVHGQSNSPTGYGVFSEGNMRSTGIISGNGSGLTALNATNILTGNLDDARLSTNVARLTLSQTFTGYKTFTGGFSTTSFQLQGVPTSGHVLKTNSAGTGTWQQDGFTLPWAASAIGSLTGLSLTHTGTGDLSNFTINNSASTAEAVQGTSNGSGDVFQAIMTGLGRAGYFSISNSASTSNAVHAITNGTGAAVYGRASGVAYSANGGHFESVSNGYAVYGLGDLFGGLFENEAAGGFAVYGRAKNNSGTGNSDLNGVLGSAFPSEGNWAVFANGDLGASGFKAFRIDHPFDPENKYLLHYASESPMPQNFYVGNVITDAAGYAWVNLPDYFSAINTNFKYQLTVVDGPNSGADDFVQVKVRQKIKEGRFQIRTSAPNTEVSWRVDADRNDLYMRRRQPKDVIDKRRREIGTYQHPELYGLGPERGMNYDPGRERKSAAPPRLRFNKK